MGTLLSWLDRASIAPLASTYSEILRSLADPPQMVQVVHREAAQNSLRGQTLEIPARRQPRHLLPAHRIHHHLLHQQRRWQSQAYHLPLKRLPTRKRLRLRLRWQSTTQMGQLRNSGTAEHTSNRLVPYLAVQMERL